eukprot:9118588-Pyramimonas_sp.AAC.1
MDSSLLNEGGGGEGRSLELDDWETRKVVLPAKRPIIAVMLFAFEDLLQDDFSRERVRGLPLNHALSANFTP